MKLLFSFLCILPYLSKCAESKTKTSYHSVYTGKKFQVQDVPFFASKDEHKVNIHPVLRLSPPLQESSVVEHSSSSVNNRPSKVPTASPIASRTKSYVYPSYSPNAQLQQNGIFYNGGNVMLGQINVYLIWYGDWSGAQGSGSNANTQSIITDFVRNLGGSPWWNILTSYTGPNMARLSNNLVYKKSITFSASGSISSTVLSTAVTNAISSKALPLDSNGIYVIIPSQDIVDPANTNSQSCSAYCGYHTYTSYANAAVTWALITNPYSCPNHNGCMYFSSGTINGNAAADAMVSVIAHELAEAATDNLLNAWYDYSGYENADKCAWKYGTSQNWNVQLGSSKYLIQQNWLNVGSGSCVTGFSAPSVPPPAPSPLPTAMPTAPSRAPTRAPTYPTKSPSVLPTSPTMSPVAYQSVVYYSFEPSTVVGSNLLNTGSGGASYNAQLFNGASISTADFMTGSACLPLVASSSQYVSVPPFSTGGGGLSFSCWFRSTGNSDWARIFDFGNGPGADNIFVFINRGALGISVYIGGYPGQYNTLIPNVNDNVWRHFTWTLTSAGAWAVYINGVSVWSAAGQYYPVAKARNYNYLGKSNWIDPYFTGAIDEFRIYSTALGPSDVKGLYRSRRSASPSAVPSVFPTAPSPKPSIVPSGPTVSPTLRPSASPTKRPTRNPSPVPISAPSMTPVSPTLYPTAAPTLSPTTVSQSSCYASATDSYSSSVSVNGVVGNKFTFSSSLTVNVKYTWNHGVSWCPSCIIQLYAGITGYDAQGTCQAASGWSSGVYTFSFSLSLPAGGCYHIFESEQMGYYCGYYGAVTDGTPIGSIWIGAIGSASPSAVPSVFPTAPSPKPSIVPSGPTVSPSLRPSASPTKRPTRSPSSPSSKPSLVPSSVPAAAKPYPSYSPNAGLVQAGIHYHNGPVMLGKINAYLIYYGDWSGAQGSGSTATVQNILGSFVGNLGGSGWWNILTSYTQGSGARLSNNLVLAGTTTVTGTTDVSETMLAQLVSKTISSGVLPKDRSGIYLVIPSQNINDPANYEFTGCSSYCGYHTSVTMSDGTPIAWGFITNPYSCPNHNGCMAVSSGSVNGNAAADAMVSVIAHELAEAATDPFGTGWWNSFSGYENADICAWTYGSYSGNSNIALGGGKYLIQQNWLNVGSGSCVMSF